MSTTTNTPAHALPSGISRSEATTRAAWVQDQDCYVHAAMRVLMGTAGDAFGRTASRQQCIHAELLGAWMRQRRNLHGTPATSWANGRHLRLRPESNRALCQVWCDARTRLAMTPNQAFSHMALAARSRYE